MYQYCNFHCNILYVIWCIPVYYKCIEVALWSSAHDRTPGLPKAPRWMRNSHDSVLNASLPALSSGQQDVWSSYERKSFRNEESILCESTYQIQMQCASKRSWYHHTLHVLMEPFEIVGLFRRGLHRYSHAWPEFCVLVFMSFQDTSLNSLLSW